MRRLVKRKSVNSWPNNQAAENSSINFPGSDISNHSLRKTQISRLIDANTPETFIAQLNGHKSIKKHAGINMLP
jgi:integrase